MFISIFPYIYSRKIVVKRKCTPRIIHYDFKKFEFFRVFFFKIASTQCHAAKEYWLNAYNINNTKLFTWLESNTTAVYNNWENGEPSHVAETCIVSDTMYGGEWADITCTYLRPVVCEKNS